MTVLQSLDRYYDRMAARGEAEDLGFTRENISFALVLGADGTIRAVDDLREKTGKKLRPRRMAVPRPKRTSNVQANFLWDKTAYSFGVDSGKSKRLDREHGEFRDLHQRMLGNLDEPHAQALLAFLGRWTPEQFGAAPFNPEMLDASFVFRLDGERIYLHDVPVLRAKWLDTLDEGEGPEGFCLVRGTRGKLEIGHPIVKAVNGAQTAGAYLVSFNADAYSSYGKPNDATNAPTSKIAAARYGAALNALLERSESNRNRLRRTIGDATVVFWADTSTSVDEEAAAAAEDAFNLFIEPENTAGADTSNPDRDDEEAVKLRDAIEVVTKGKPVRALNPKLVPGTEFHVLGLAPNAARLSVRYWLSDSFEAFAERLGRHYADLEIEPRPRGWGAGPGVNRLLAYTTALLGKFDNIPNALAGEVMRAVLTGAPYPQTLLTAVLMRLRAGDDPGTGWHAAVIKACINRAARTKEEMLPVALNPESTSTAYQLGRLFYVLESAQRAALGKVNATIADRYYGAASSTPARVFGPLLRGLRNHISDARKRGQGGWIEPKVAEIMSHLPEELPKTLRLEDQGRFAVGYYHERASRPDKADPARDEGAATTEGDDSDE